MAHGSRLPLPLPLPLPLQSPSRLPLPLPHHSLSRLRSLTRCLIRATNGGAIRRRHAAVDLHWRQGSATADSQPTQLLSAHSESLSGHLYSPPTSEKLEDPPRPGKHSYIYYFKIESQKLKEEGVKVKGRIRDDWLKLSAKDKAEFINSYNENAEMNSRLPSGLLSEPIPIVENNSDKGIHLSRCSVLRFSNIISSLSIEQQDAVREIGFGSLLGLKCGRLRQDLCRLLVKQCNVDKRSITVHGMEYKLTPKTFTSVMGVGDGGTPIVLSGEDSEITDLRAKYCSGKKGIPIATYINPSYLYALKDVSNIRSKNWASWSFNFLWEEVSKFNENKISSLNGCVIFLMLFYMSSTKFQLSFVAENGCPLSAWTDSEMKRFLKWRQKYGDFGSNAVSMREISCGTSSAQSEGQIDDGDTTRQHPFHALLAVMDRMEEHMRRNNDLLQKISLKMDSLTEKVEKLERSYFRKGVNVADDSQSSPTYTGAEATDGPIFSSLNMEMHPPIPAVVTLSDLVREKRTPIEVKERKVVYLSTSTDEEAVLKEKLVGVLQDAMNLNWCRNLTMSEIIVRSSHEDITRRGLFSLLPDASLDEEYDPSKLFCMTHTLFRDNPLPPPPKPKPKPKLRPPPRPVTFYIPGQHSPGHTPASPPVPSPPTESQPPSQSKDKQPMHQFSAHTVDHSSPTADQTSDSNLAVSDSHTDTDTELLVDTEDSVSENYPLARKVMSVVIHMWDEVSDVIDDAEKLLNLSFGKLLIWKVKQFLGNVFSWLIMAIFYVIPRNSILSVAMFASQRANVSTYLDDFRRRENFSFMASTSSLTSSNPVTLSSTLSLPKSCTSHTANKIENLVEYSYIPESAQISESSYPLISPYQLYKRPSSFTRSIRTLISTRRPHPKEYIQSSRLDQCSLQATPAEQYVTLEIPSELISNWKREGYTHLYLEGIRLILTLHGRKGLPVTARIAMLDTRFKQYQDAIIGTVLTTLHAGSVLLTFYPNFNLSLQDPNLPTTLKVQVQIQGAEQISSAKIATLHHQLVYRLQNHALDLPTLEHHSDTLMVLAESDQIPTIIQIPRQIPRHELIKLMPLEWISNYEQFHNNTAPIQTSESMFERRQDGTVRMTFKPPPSAPQEPPRLSFTYSSMITAVQTAQEDLPITGFNSQAYPIYPAKHNGHFLWDAPGSGMCDPTCPCWDDWEDDDDYATTRKKKPKKKKPPVPCHHCDSKPPSDPPPPPVPLPIYRKELKWIAKHCKSEIPSPFPNPIPIVQPLACMMFSSTSSDYSSSFPPLEPHIDSQRNIVSKPFVPSPITSTGHLEPPKPFESVLNWQTQNARAQNDTLLHLNSKVENISLRTEQIETKVDPITAQMQQIHQNLQSRIGQLDSELRAMLDHRYNGPEFDQKEREIRRLKAELAQIEYEKQRPTLFTTSPPIPSIGPTYHPFASMLSPIKQYDPSKLFGMTHTLFRDNPLPPPPKPKPKPRPQPRPAPLHPSSLTIHGQPSPSSTPASPLAPLSVPTQSKDKEPMNQFTAHTVTHSSTIDDPTSDSNLAVSDSPTETDTESSASTSDSEKSYADITKILMAQPHPTTQGQTSHTEPYVDIPSEVEEEMHESSATNHPPPAQTNPSSQKSSNGPWFTFDDLPSHKWRDRLNEMSAWIDLQMLRPGATTQSVLREFATRFTGALRDWFDSLGQYRQLQFVDLPEVSSALAVLHDQFLGDPSAVFEAARRDYLNMKCCSLNAKDLDFYYKRMSLLFYKLNGFNEPTLKHVFLASLPDELQPNIQRQLTASNLSLDNISLGKIFQLAKTCLDKLCEQK
ncbi:hypothetical protein KPL71_008131 [Citrus sinensis]|uniref:Uncharacterized protein n=1 Tax=Citrus sinensis TaxID=2711 RepID=A0ACB8M457_CITSI|nr:hypothetical protein KPL71_008131 [Citrus sinensis]